MFARADYFARNGVTVPFVERRETKLKDHSFFLVVDALCSVSLSVVLFYISTPDARFPSPPSLWRLLFLMKARSSLCLLLFRWSRTRIQRSEEIDVRFSDVVVVVRIFGARRKLFSVRRGSLSCRRLVLSRFVRWFSSLVSLDLVPEPAISSCVRPPPRLPVHSF